MDDEKVLKKIKDFWEDEIISTSLYDFLSRREKNEKYKEMFKKFARMENEHARHWENIAKKEYNKTFKKNIFIYIKLFFMKLVAIILPLTFLIYYLELGERSAILDYSLIAEHFKNKPDMKAIIDGIIHDELTHEINVMEAILGEKATISNVRDAIYGMTDSLIEILALVIGLAGAIHDPVVIGLAGMIAAIGGTFSMTAGAYLSTKSEIDLNEGKLREIEAKSRANEHFLKKDLELALQEKGIPGEQARLVVENTTDPTTIKNLVVSLTTEEIGTSAKDSAITTGIYYILGALPAVVPFFLIFIYPGMDSITAAIIAIILSAIVSFGAGVFTAVLSGISIKSNALKNVVIIIGSAGLTYLIGMIARILLGIEI